MQLTAPPAHRASVRSWPILLLALAAMVTPLAACSLPGGQRSEPSVTVDRRDPTDGDMTRLRQQMAALPHVTDVDLNYKPETFGYEAMYFGVITSDAKDQATLDATADAAYRIVWTTRDVEMGALDFYVTNPAIGRSAGAVSLGMTKPPLYEELERRYGPRPTPSAT
jgi:hypothetical protein